MMLLLVLGAAAFLLCPAPLAAPIPAHLRAARPRRAASALLSDTAVGRQSASGLGALSVGELKRCARALSRARPAVRAQHMRTCIIADRLGAPRAGTGRTTAAIVP